jgi:hypothetical protein
MLIDDIEVSPEGLAELNRQAARIKRIAKKIGFPGPLTWEALKRRDPAHQRDTLAGPETHFRGKNSGQARNGA